MPRLDVLLAASRVRRLNRICTVHPRPLSAGAKAGVIAGPLAKMQIKQGKNGERPHVI
jgi:hypothetical protein